MSRVRCPICEKVMEVARLSDWPSFPFCSSKCRTIDLGRWLGKRYSLPADMEPLDEEAGLDSDEGT